MKQIRQYSWILTILGGGILIALGVSLKLSGDTGEKLVLMICGILLIVFSLIRLFPIILVSQKDSIMMKVQVIEIFVNVVAGVFLIFMGNQKNSDIGQTFKYILGVILYARGFITLFMMARQSEKYELTMFLGGIIFLSVGMFIITRQDFTVATLIVVFLFASLISGGYLIYNGSNKYRKYRKAKSDLLNEAKEIVNKDQEKANILPSKNQEEETPTIQA